VIAGGATPLVVGIALALAAALLAHGLLDLVHGRLIANPGVPTWWPGFCLAYDVTLAGALAWRLLRARRFAAPLGGA
jgi:hypothetical protein